MDIRKRAIELRENGMKVTDIAVFLCLKETTVWSYIKPLRRSRNSLYEDYIALFKAKTETCDIARKMSVSKKYVRCVYNKLIKRGILEPLPFYGAGKKSLPERTRALRAAGLSYKAIANELEIKCSVVYYYLNKK